ncbi:DNA cytosine methyltransferase [Paenibacillus sp. FSL H7-0323]|uniref:DNA cytosine methyltransferase n=1 Tax=Paenibacillus sp. FSL H7-0323 TaxID=2921433 RepID=UPI0030FCD226
MNTLSLFSGIAGIDLAAEWAGMQTIAFCEREPFPQKVLRKHWPDVPIYDDVCTLTREVLEKDGILSATRTIDIISAGFPCQPFSNAGQRGGTDDERYLWPEVVRILQDVQPTWFVGENVAGILSMAEPNGLPAVESRTVQSGEEEDFYEAVFTQQEIMLFGNICKDLEDIGYEVQPFVVPAAAVGAKHLRERVFIVGYSEHFRRNATAFGRGTDSTSDNLKEGQKQTSQPSGTSGRTDNEALGDTTSKGLPQWGQPRWSESNPQDGTRMDAEFERSSEVLADTDSLRDNGQGKCGTDGNRQEIMQERELSQHGFSDDSQNVADHSSFGRQGQRKPIQPIDSKTCGERKTSESLNVCFGTERTTQSLLGGIPNEFSSWMDGSGVNPLDAFGEYIANYPQPAPLSLDQYSWEPPRVATGVKERTGRLKALGNAVDPLQIYPVMAAIKAIDDAMIRKDNLK